MSCRLRAVMDIRHQYCNCKILKKRRCSRRLGVQGADSGCCLLRSRCTPGVVCPCLPGMTQSVHYILGHLGNCNTLHLNTEPYRSQITRVLDMLIQQPYYRTVLPQAAGHNTAAVAVHSMLSGHSRAVPRHAETHLSYRKKSI
ncbi:hypothetical protein J6590_014106 [Homalodisca vitripennis]|nr:hypothetical protein J6590_014106 [Homalodisca vitripennis]